MTRNDSECSWGVATGATIREEEALQYKDVFGKFQDVR
jgi:hypothetical protein